MNKVFLFFLLSIMCITMFSQSEITENELKNHIKFLTSDKNAGRSPGGKENKWIVKYIEKEFKRLKISSFEIGYRQFFNAELRVDKGVEKKPVVKTCNVVGFIEGNDSILKNDFIVLGAHYDHLGLGGPSSKSEKRGVVYHGADDNASGT